MLGTTTLGIQNKRHRLNDEDFGASSSGHQYGDTTVNDHGRVLQGNSYDTHYHVHKGSKDSQTAASTTPSVKDLVHSLRFKNIDSRFHNIQPALAKTCQWLFDHETYLSWNNDALLKEHRGFLWIKGKPGTGKSTLMKAALQRAKRTRPKNNCNTVSYFFNARASTNLEKSPLGLYRSLIYQILQAESALLADFDEMFSWKHFDGYDWTEAELKGFLVEVAKSEDRSPLCVFIDALDEGNDEDVRALVAFLEDLTSHASGFSLLRICLSSRHYPHITIRKGLTLVVEAQEKHDQDIRIFVSERLNGPGAERVHTEVCRKSAGIFLWVVLVVPILNQMHDRVQSATEMMTYLQSLPGDLEGVFTEILRRDANGYQKCVSLLQWVLYSTRPLSPVELFLAVQYSSAHPNQGEVLLPAEETINRYLVHNSHGLVEVTRSDFEPPVTQFIHETVREFLTGKNGLCRLDDTLDRNLLGSSHARLAEACLCYFKWYLVSIPFVPTPPDVYSSSCTDRIGRDFPFVRYAIWAILSHAEVAEQHGVPQTGLLSLLRERASLSNWKRLRNSFERYRHRRYVMDDTLLYIAVDMEFLALTRVLAKDSVLVNIWCGRYGSALQCACRRGNEGIVKCLLDQDADISVQGREYGNPLLATIAAESLEVLRLLLRYRRWSSRSLSQALDTCVQATWIMGVKTLSGYGAAPTSEFGALHTAAQNCHAGIVKHLLERGAEVDMLDFKGNTPLILAVCSGSEKVTNLLMQSGADIYKSSKCGSQQTIPHWAMRNGVVPATRALLQYRRTLEALDSHGNTILHAAAGSGSLEKVNLTLRQAPDIDKRNQTGQTALHVAVMTSSPSVVEVILQHGADIDAKDHNGNTPLHIASRFRSSLIPTLKVILSHGADIRTRNNHGHSPADCAAECRNSECIVKLFEHNKALDGNERSRLWNLSRQPGNADNFTCSCPCNGIEEYWPKSWYR